MNKEKDKLNNSIWYTKMYFLLTSIQNIELLSYFSLMFVSREVQCKQSQKFKLSHYYISVNDVNGIFRLSLSFR